jgi:tetratricopeptide (TPR) repeat protein
VARARAAVAALPASAAEHPLAVPAALFTALSGLRYHTDPAVPFAATALDQVLYPRQTLASGGGDCDDLSVLYAALSEAAGRRALLLVAPDHVFVAVHAGVPESAGLRVALDEGRLLRHAGALWVPLEVTRPETDFVAAWKRGAQLLAAWRAQPGALQVIAVREAWSRFPTVDLSGSKPLPRWAPDPAAIKGQLDALEGGYRADAERRLAALAGAQGADALNRRGVLLTLLGRYGAATKALESAISVAKAPAEPLNNLGNLQLLRGAVVEARATYDRALAGRGDDPQIHFNAALAALSAGDEAGFDEHLFSCVEHGGDALARALAEAGAQGSGTRGVQGGGLASARLGMLVGRVRARAGHAALDAPGARASQDGGRVALGRFVLWLMSAPAP